MVTFSFKYPLIIVIIIFLLTSAFVIVQSGHVGVVRTLGAVQPEALPEGIHFKKPFIFSFMELGGISY